jgi:hypothetical protein
VISVPALAYNAFDMLRRSQGTTIRVTSKSVRVRGVIDAVLSFSGYSECSPMYPARSALARSKEMRDTRASPDVVVAHPSVDVPRRPALDPLLASRG